MMLTTVGSLLLVSACDGTPSAAPPSKNFLYESLLGYSVSVPTGFSYAEKAPSNAHFYFGYPNTNIHGLYTIDLHESLDIKCVPALYGVSSGIALSTLKEKASWGRVDAWDEKTDGWEPPYPSMQDIVCRYDGTPRPAAVYALCSERDAKTVIICISQASDDPDMAKHIFETFHWRE